MIRISILGLMAFALLLSCNVLAVKAQGTINNPLGRVLFRIDLPNEIDAAGVTIPAGEYVVRDMGVASQNLLSLSYPDQLKPIVLVQTTRRQLVAGREEVLKPALVFEDEHVAKPVLKEIRVPGLDDYIIVTAIVTDQGTRTNITNNRTAAGLRVIPQTTAEPPTNKPLPPAPIANPEPQPKMEPTPQPEPEPQPQPDEK